MKVRVLLATVLVVTVLLASLRGGEAGSKSGRKKVVQDAQEDASGTFRIVEGDDGTHVTERLHTEDGVSFFVAELPRDATDEQKKGQRSQRTNGKAHAKKERRSAGATRRQSSSRTGERASARRRRN